MRPAKFHLEDKYYKTGDLIKLKDKELNNLIKNKNLLLYLFINQYALSQII